MKKRDYIVVAAIFTAVSLAGLWVATGSARVQVVYPKANPVLYEKDFTVDIKGTSFGLGKSSMEEVVSVLPEGKTLGMSTVYKTYNPECIFTFNGKRTSLKKVHILDNQVSTYRGLKVGDSLKQVVKAYGPNYIYSGRKGQRQDFEAIYSQDKKRSLIFSIRQGKVRQIVLVEEMWPDKAARE